MMTDREVKVTPAVDWICPDCNMPVQTYSEHEYSEELEEEIVLFPVVVVCPFCSIKYVAKYE